MRKINTSSVLQSDRRGTTLVELLIAVVIIGLMASAIYTGGSAILRHAQSVTIMTAAQLYAKEGLEEAEAKGYDILSGGAPIAQEIMANPNTHHVVLTRVMDIVWHDRSCATSSVPVSGGYAEIIARVFWQVPRTSNTASTVMSTLLYQRGAE